MVKGNALEQKQEVAVRVAARSTGCFQHCKAIQSRTPSAGRDKSQSLSLSLKSAKAKCTQQDVCPNFKSLTKLRQAYFTVTFLKNQSALTVQ